MLLCLGQAYSVGGTHSSSLGDALLLHDSTIVNQVLMAWMALHRLNADHTMQAQCGAISEHKAKVARHRHSRPGASAKAQADADARPESGMSSLMPAGRAWCPDPESCSAHCVATKACGEGFWHARPC